MANFLINSPGLVTTGTNASETFLVQSAATTATTILAAAGNDTIQFLEGATSAEKVSVNGAGGADLIEVSSTVFDSATKFALGAGGDTVTFTAGGVNGSILFGDGSDLLQINQAAEINTVAFGAGADVASASAAVSASAADVAFGSGKDTLSFAVGGNQLNDAKFNLGGGADFVLLSSNTQSATAATIKGGAGGDTIEFNLAQVENLIVKGGNGSDILKQSAQEIQDSSQILGGGGADSISILTVSASATDSNVKVGGGAGKDTLVFALSSVEGVDASILGGGGNDSINVAVTIDVTAATAGTVFGGAGSDSITFSGTFGNDSGIATKVGISNFSDSTLSSTDVVTFTFSGTDGSGGVLDFRTDGIGTNLSMAASLTNNQITIGASGIVSTFTSTLSDVTSRVEGIDKLATSTGQVVLFEDAAGSAGYLFIQGGATDTVVKINEAGGALSGAGFSAVTVANSSVQLDFIGS